MEGPTSVTVHPVVLLSVVDHYNRVASGTKNKRVVGVLLGEKYLDGRVDVTNSFAVPFDEDNKNPSIFYLNHDYMEEMFSMFRKVSARERIVGWYHSGPKIRESDLAINDIFRKYVAQPVLTIIDVHPRESGLPTEAYYAVEEIKDDGSEPRKTFRHISSAIEAEEAEEVGVEHLLRDINESTLSTLSNDVKHQVGGLVGLGKRLANMRRYLELVAEGRIPINHEIVAEMQNAFNLLPNLAAPGVVEAFAVKTNDNSVVMWVAGMMRSIMALHDLLDNKRAFAAATDGDADASAAADSPPAPADAAAPASPPASD